MHITAWPSAAVESHIVANRPGTSGAVPDLKALSWIPKFTWIVLDFQGSSDRSGFSSFIEGHLALASVEQ